MKSFFTRSVILFLMLAVSFSVTAQQNFFNDAPETALQKAGQKRVIIPEKYRTLQLDTTAMLPFLRSLPAEQSITNRDNAPVMMIPMPDGSVARFHVWECAIMEPGLATAFPLIRTYSGQGIDDPTATIKFDWTEFGFHGMILSPVTGAVLVDPYSRENTVDYISYFKQDYKNKKVFVELPTIEAPENNNARGATPLAGSCTGTQLRTYRLALACTGEYAVAATGSSSPTKAATLSAVVTSINRVDGVYEKEIAVRLVLVANDTAVLFTNSSTDPFSGNNSATTLINESQTVIDSRIGSANYDIGHTFSTGGGGLAQRPCVCVSGQKARGITGSSAPVGDAYDIDYVAHEMGHQFGGSHTFNSVTSNCAPPNVSTTTNAEPGSGISIMAYAGICGADDLALHSIPEFHAISFDEITQYSISGNGNGCAVTTSTGNIAPVVNAGSDYTIPKSTFFVLTGSATDANNDALTYSWEQVDVGGPTGAWNMPSGNAAIFRSFDPVSSPVRYFPKLSDQTGNTTTIGEILPSYARTMKFRLTARDNRAGGGGVCYDENVITVADLGPFTVTYPTASGTIWSVNDFKTITWDPAGTTGAPINCANVSIQLSTDGGNTFPNTLVASTPNTGSYEIQVPALVGTQNRIRVMAVGNIFYDISNSNFRIQNATSPSFSFNNPAAVELCSGNSATATLLSGALGSFSTTINLTASLNPAGTTVSFGTSTLTPGNSTTVTLNNMSSLPDGVYTVRVTGVAGALNKFVDITFIKGSPAPATLLAPGADSTGLSTLPVFDWDPVQGATSYTLELAATSDFSTILQIIPGITAPPYTLVSPLAENSTYYWRVKTTNSCGTGSPAAIPSRFKTGVSSCQYSTNVPVSIPVNGTPRVSSTLTIPASNAVTITDLNIIGLTATHSRVNDLTFILIAPTGDSVVVLNQVCSGNAGFNLNLDDQAATAVTCPAINGITVKPSNPLSAFNGINSAGTWTLAVKDNTTGSGGNLTGWGLNINGGDGTTCTTVATPLATVYTFTGTGNWNLASNWANNTIPPSTLPAGASIVINHSVGGVCNLNVAQTIASGASLTVMTGKNLVVMGNLTVQ